MLSRVVTDVTRRELDRQESAEFYLVFLTINQRDLKDAITVVSDPEDFTLNSVLFKGFQFDIKLLNDGESMPQAQLTVQNVDKSIGNAILNISDPPRLEIQVIAGSMFDLGTYPRVPIYAADTDVARVYRAKQLYLTEVEGDEMTVSGTIRSWDYTQETWPGMRATANRFPGLYY